MRNNHEITIESGFVRVRLIPADAVSSSSVGEFFALVPDAARDAGVSKVLYDARGAIGSLSTLDRFEYASSIAERFKNLQVAFVLRQPLRDPDFFGETVAVNRGANIRVVETLAEAYEWLEVEPPDKSTGEDGKEQRLNRHV